MALFVNQNHEKTDLQQRVAAELREKARKKALETDQPDGVTDSAYLKNTKSTTSLAWVWVAIVIFAVSALIFYIMLSSK